MENKAIARLLMETADLMEIAAEDPFRIRTGSSSRSTTGRSGRGPSPAGSGWPQSPALSG